MSMLVHLADEKKAKSILRSGIKPGKYMGGVYCMPVLPHFYITHQWLRELKSNGVKTIVAVYFKVDDLELVYAGRYNKPHGKINLGKAVREIMDLEDPLGYELIITRKIESSEILRIKNLPQNIGWRYMPNSHDVKPCTCEFCIRGTIRAGRLRTKREEEK